MLTTSPCLDCNQGYGLLGIGGPEQAFTVSEASLLRFRSPVKSAKETYVAAGPSFRKEPVVLLTSRSQRPRLKPRRL